MQTQSLFVTCLFTIVATATVTATEHVDLGTIQVEGSPLSNYRVGTVSSATFFDAPPEALPFSIDVLTGDFIREQNPDDLHQLLFHQPGVYGGGKSMMDRTSGQYTLRGRAGTTPTLNGTLPVTAAMGMFLDPNAIDRVEIVRGPIGGLQGGQPSSLGAYGAGGAINLIPKQAVSGISFTEVGLRFSTGTDSRKIRMTGDRNEAMTDSLSLRLPLSIETGKPFWLPSGHDWRRSVFLAPSLLWEPAETLRLRINTTFQHTDTPGYQGIPSFRGKPIDPWTWNSYLPGTHDLRDTYTGYSIQGIVEWDASDVWQFQGGVGYAGSDMEYEHIGASTYAESPGSPIVRAFDHNYADRHDDVFTLHARATAGYDALGMTHTTLFQADTLRRASRARNAYARLPGPEARVRLPKGLSTETTLSRHGLLLQEFAEAGPFRLLGALRYDHHESNLDHTAEVLSPRAGLSFLPTRWLTLFGNVSRTESPNFGHMKNETQELTSSWQADQWEVGFRVQPVSALWLSLAYYDIRQSGTPSFVDETGFYEAEGKSENTGVEISLSGQMTENWSISLGYAHTRNKTVPGEKAYDAHPPHAVTLQTQYRVSRGVLRDLAFGLGYRYQHDYDGTFRGAYVGPDYMFEAVHVLDASIDIPLTAFGGASGWTVQVGVKNILDTDYFESNRHYYHCFPGEPRTLELALRGRF